MSAETSSATEGVKERDRHARMEACRERLERCAALPTGDARALSLLDEAVQLDPYSFRARRSLALALHREGRAEDAHLAYQEALRLIPDDSVTLAHHGLLLYQAWRNEKESVELLTTAVERFEAAHHCDPNDLFAALGLIDVYLECPIVEVTPKIVSLLQQVPPSAAGAPGFIARYLKLAIAMRRLGRSARELIPNLCRKLLETWRPLIERCPELRWLEAAAELLSSSHEALPEVYARRRNEVSPQALLFVLIQERLAEVGQDPLRAQLVEQMRKLQPGDPFLRQEALDLNHRKARRALALGQRSDARALWSRAMEQDPGNDRLVHNLALIALAENDLKAIEQHWDRLTRLWIAKAELFPEEANSFYELLGLRSKLFSDRIYAQLERGEVPLSEAPRVAETYLGLALQSFVLRGLALDAPEPEPLRPMVEEDLSGFLRFSLQSLVELCRDGLFKAPEQRPPFLYEALGISKDAPRSVVAEASERLLMQSGALQDARAQDAVAVLSDPEQRAEYNAETLDWERHRLNAEKAGLLRNLELLLRRYPSREMTMLVQKVVLNFDFGVYREYFDETDAELYTEVRDQLIQGYCHDVLMRRFEQPDQALLILDDVTGAVERWHDANDCCTLARIFNECELIHMNRNGGRRSSVNGLAKGITFLERARDTATNIETRARILQQLADIEVQEPGDVIATPSDGDPEIRQRLTMALTEIRSRKYDQARNRLESILKRRPDECGALLMMAKITLEEALLAWRMTKDFKFFESQLAEAMGLLRRIEAHPSAPQEFKGPCMRMIWQINGNLAKAKEMQTKAPQSGQLPEALSRLDHGFGAEASS
jgi:Tfp pilus assembly protein PilF